VRRSSSVRIALIARCCVCGLTKCLCVLALFAAGTNLAFTTSVNRALGRRIKDDVRKQTACMHYSSSLAMCATSGL